MTDKRLLVIDDDQALGTLMRRVAQDLGYETEVLTRPEQFKQTYGRFNPTVIVLDIVMPSIDGIELVQWLASVNCAARIIMVSGFDPQFLDAAIKLAAVRGLSAIITLRKPFSVTDLRIALT